MSHTDNSGIRKVEYLQKRIFSEPLYGRSCKFAIDRIGSVKNKRILDTGCGTGRISEYFTRCGAEVIGIDVNKQSLEVSTDRLKKVGLSQKCFFIHTPAEFLPFKSSSVDIIFSKSTMQYMNQKKVLKEYYRVLKPTGILVLIENMPYSPLINVYRVFRRLTANTKAKKEYLKTIIRYLSLNDIKYFEDYYESVTHEEYHLFRILSLFFITKNNNKLLLLFDDLLSKLDIKLLIMFPLLRNIAWFTSIISKGKKHV